MSDTDEIKSRLNIVDIVGERVKLKKAGRNFKGLCPFHTEKTPSFIVSPDRQTFHCFGCGKGGDIFSFVMEFDRVDFTEALETLAERAGVALSRRIADTPEAKLKQQIFEVNHLASEYYHYLLTSHKIGEHARLYLKKRGISDKSIQTFGLGYSPNNWDGLLSFLKKRGYDEVLLEKAGLVLRSSRSGRGARHYDRFRGRVMFTLKDHRSNVVGFSGRVLEPQVKEAKYINTAETPVYIKGNVLYGLDVTKAAIQKTNEAILMEGELDVISSFQAGISNVTAIKGSALTENHARLLRRFCERLVFALDSDIAGDAAARRGIEIAENAGFDMRVLRLPSGKDPDEAVREHAGLVKKAIENAQPIYDYLLASALSRYDAKSSFGKKKIADEYSAILLKIDNSIVRGHYIRELARVIDIPQESVQEELDRASKRKGYRKTAQEKVPALPGRPSLSRLEQTELYLLSLLLQGQTSLLLGKLKESTEDMYMSYRPVRAILEKLETYVADHKTFDAAAFANTLPPELTSLFDEAFLWDISGFVEDELRFMREWDKAVREVKRLFFKKRMEEITGKLRDSDLSNDKYTDLHNELRTITQSLATLEKSA